MMPHGPGAITFSTAALVALAFLAGGCRGRRVESPGTHVSNGDILSGRLDPQVPGEAFTFEGVESSLLDFTLQSDELNRGAPDPVLTAPDGQVVDLHGHRMTPEGAATTRYEGVILRRTGTYRLTVDSTDTSRDSWYLYRHALRFPSIVDERARLTAAATHPISFTAPYGATVSVRVRPANSPLQPDVRGVIDPLGGRALDPGATPGGVLPPQMAPTTDGGVLLMFVAPRAGRYTVLAAAKPGHEGEARIDVDVTPPSFDRAVWHPGSDPTAALGPPTVLPSIGGAPLMQRCSTRTVTPVAPATPSTAGGWSEPAPVVMPASTAPVARR